MARIGIDFDGVLHKPTRGKGRFGGPVLPGALEAMRKLNVRHSVFVFSSAAQNEGGALAIREWLTRHEFPVVPILGKPDADIYVDDKGLHHWDWPSTRDLLSQRGVRW